jgi:hypothetical protein
VTSALAHDNAADELLRLFEDPLEYIETLLTIRSKRGAEIPFILNPVQRKVMAKKAEAVAAGKPRKFLILKARRQGVTTLEQALNFWVVATQRNQQVMTLAHNDDSTEKIFRIPSMFFDKLVKEFRPTRLTASNKRDLNFPKMNSLYYIGTAGSKGLGRGDTLNRVHWSEVAWSRGSRTDQELLLDGLTEACSEGEIVLESTPNGVGDLFHEMWTEASKGAGEWTPIFSPWWDDPTYRRRLTPERERELLASLTEEEKELVGREHLDAGQIAWRRAKKEDKKKRFEQEYPENSSSCFLVSGSCFFDKTKIADLMKRVTAPIEVKDDGQLIFFERCKAGHRYVAGCDVAEGVPDGDFSVCTILDGETLAPVAVLRGRWRPEDFATRTEKLCKGFNMALLGVERNNHGHSCLNTLKNTLHYPKLYHHNDYDEKTKVSTPELGFPTNMKTRPIMLDDLRAAIEEEHLPGRDRVLLEECLTFQDNGKGKYQAREGCHDDTVLSNAIAIQVRKGMGAKASVPADAPAAPKRVFPRPPKGGFFA